LKSVRKILISILICVAVTAYASIFTTAIAAPENTVVFLVRHAEKMDASGDPDLSGAGRQRASELAQVLRDAEIDRIHSTDYIRTRDTAAPLAAMLGLKPEFYDPTHLAEFAQTLTQQGQRHLVVGHSNTTPELVRLLGGEPGSPIQESSEYDRLYIVTMDESGVTTVLMRYGTSSGY
jgi:broad specificity phosphatase PhoE